MCLYCQRVHALTNVWTNGLRGQELDRANVSSTGTDRKCVFETKLTSSEKNFITLTFLRNVTMNTARPAETKWPISDCDYIKLPIFVNIRTLFAKSVGSFTMIHFLTKLHMSNPSSLSLSPSTGRNPPICVDFEQPWYSLSFCRKEKSTLTNTT